MRNDIDFVDCDGEGLVYDDEWITPSYSRGYRKLRLNDSIALYYRFSSQYVFFNIVLSFDYLGARAPRSLPILFYGYISMLEVWEKLEELSE